MAEVRALREEIEAADPTIDQAWARLIPCADLMAWEGHIPPSRQWVLEDWLPRGQASYLTGPGSAGKSLLAQQLCTCVALGLPFMGVATKQTQSMYLTCEDDFDELQRRQDAICKALDVPLARLRGVLQLVSLAGHIGAELATFPPPSKPDEFGIGGELIRPSSRFRALEGTAIARNIGFIALDNVAHLFAGNENIRVEVAAFVGLLNRLAQHISGSVLLIGHPNKQGDSFSGSTAWENQVRSRLFLEILKSADGNIIDPDVRVLRREKANYAGNAAEVTFRWHQWAYVRDIDLPDDQREALGRAAQNRADEEVFLVCLNERLRQKRAVSEKRSPSFAPTVFDAMPESKRIGRKRLEAAMDALWRSGRIERAELWKGPDRKPVIGLRGTVQTTHAGNAGDDA